MMSAPIAIIREGLHTCTRVSSEQYKRLNGTSTNWHAQARRAEQRLHDPFQYGVLV
jgi:hypothetical protein